jgi:outer membrane protein assembly factor BamD (BamD/ComL family)
LQPRHLWSKRHPAQAHNGDAHGGLGDERGSLTPAAHSVFFHAMCALLCYRTRFMQAKRVILAAVFSFAALLATATWAGEKPYREETAKRGFWVRLFHRPHEKTPAAQLAFANRLFDKGRVRKAARAYYALTKYWPESPEAAEAQYRYARIMDRKGNVQDAFDEYQRLIDKYPHGFPYDEVLQRQFELAKLLMETRKGKFLFFPGFQAPERAVPLFEKVVANGPEWEKAAEAQYLIGYAQEQALEYEAAIAAYAVVQQRYGNSPFAEDASYRLVLCWKKLADESPNNQQLLNNAWVAAMFYLNTYPMSERVQEIREISRVVLDRRAEIAYNIARYYDRTVKKTAAAKSAYEICIREFPQSIWAEKARRRLAELSSGPSES